MPTDDERREAARKLREIELMRLSDSDSEMEAIHEAVGCWFGQPHFDQEVTDRLADLIEPSGHECVPGECPLNVRHDSDFIDRDALLELADDIDKQTDGSMFDAWLEDGHLDARPLQGQACG